ncbi:hypothetical protein BYT27DRAFT_7203196 [Phlegmacium glaucopus]|nr:hypothetical protein BYT27DRAFT_7203196 [Phlegmacium glaucopus]
MPGLLSETQQVLRHDNKLINHPYTDALSNLEHLLRPTFSKFPLASIENAANEGYSLKVSLVSGK